MQRVEQMTLSPGTCLVTGKHAGAAIDTGRELYREFGATPDRIYLAESACGAMASLFGWVSPQQAAEYDERIAGLEADVERWRSLADGRADLEATVVDVARRLGLVDSAGGIVQGDSAVAVLVGFADEADEFDKPPVKPRKPRRTSTTPASQAITL